MFRSQSVAIAYFVPVFKYCYSDRRNIGTVMRAGGLAPENLIQPTISLEMPVPSQGHYVFTVFRLLTEFVCLYNYEFWLSLWKIVRSSVILLLPLFNHNCSRLLFTVISYNQSYSLFERIRVVNILTLKTWKI